MTHADCVDCQKGISASSAVAAPCTAGSDTPSVPFPLSRSAAVTSFWTNLRVVRYRFGCFFEGLLALLSPFPSRR
jgi:hypothetical protein